MNAKNKRYLKEPLDENDVKFRQIRIFFKAVLAGIILYQQNIKSELKRRQNDINEY